MLVLSRKKEESVVLGGSITPGQSLKVTVLEIGTGTVKLGFEADAAVPVFRQEIWDRMRANGELGRPGPLPGITKNEIAP